MLDGDTDTHDYWICGHLACIQMEAEETSWSRFCNSLCIICMYISFIYIWICSMSCLIKRMTLEFNSIKEKVNIRIYLRKI